MKKAKMFQRGQIWYWEDPLYGRKGHGTQFPPGEVTLRGSRYVLIIQSDDTIIDSGIICVPCSSSNQSMNDIQIPMAHVWCESYTYAKCRNIFAAHPKYLKKFICTIPEEVMSLIDAEIIRLTLPSIRKKLNDEDIKEFLGIDLNATPETQYTAIERHYEETVVQFMNSELVYTGNANDRVTALTLKQAFDIYCVNNNITLLGDMLRFMDSVMRNINPNVTRIYGWKNLDNNPWNITELQGVCLPPVKLVVRTDKKEYPPATPKDAKEPTKAKRVAPGKNIWTDDNVREFLTMYNEKGAAETAKHYGLSDNSARRYKYKFVSEFKDISDEVQDPKTSPVTVPRRELTMPSSKDAARAVSKLSNIIRDYLVNNKVHKQVKDWKKDTDIFYVKLQSTIYYSLMEFLHIRVNGSKVYLPAITKTTPNLDSWRFIDFLYHDMNVSKTEDLVQLAENMRKFHPGILIGSGWIDILIKRLVKREFSEADVRIIFNDVWDMIVT